MTPRTYIETTATPAHPRPQGSTAAQQFTVIGYGEKYPAMQFNVECEDIEDLKKCVKIIDSYNRFDQNTVCIGLNRYLYLNKFWNENNPNNGRNLFTFEIGREYSPVIYVTFSHYNRAGGDIVKVLTDRENTLLYTEEYPVKEFANEFRTRCKKFAIDAHADECQEIDPGKYDDSDGLTVIKYRFWWD